MLNICFLNYYVDEKKHGDFDKINSDVESTKSDDCESTTAVDQMSPNERVKVAKSRISQMFIKREQQQLRQNCMAESFTEESLNSHVDNTIINNNVFVFNPNYVRVYENIDNYGHYQAVIEDRQNSGDSYKPTVELVDENVVLNNNNKSYLMESDQPDESSKPEIAPIKRRPPRFGNSMLIDELKKRQSTLNQVTPEKDVED